MLEEAKKVFCSVVAGFPLSARCVRLQCPRALEGGENERSSGIAGANHRHEFPTKQPDWPGHFIPEGDNKPALTCWKRIFWTRTKIPVSITGH